jgi:hypothetical protein
MTAQLAAKDFPVVCVGGSAGGLDAYTRLLQRLPNDMGVAIVIVNHLRIVATHLHEIPPNFTAMPVDLITDGLVLRPNHVFIIPAQRDLHVLDGEFHLKPISKPRGWPDVITVFCVPSRRIGTARLSRSSSLVMMATARRRFAASRKQAALPLRKSLRQPANRTCPRARSKPDVSILFFHPRISLRK